MLLHQWGMLWPALLIHMHMCVLRTPCAHAQYNSNGELAKQEVEFGSVTVLGFLTWENSATNLRLL